MIEESSQSLVADGYSVVSGYCSQNMISIAIR